MSIYIPYFYVIQEVATGMYYAGAKWGQDANPENFMIEGGYTTSSGTIKDIIDKTGLESFIIRKIKIFETGKEAHDYETKFLQRIDSRNHSLFYNTHNNDHLLTFGSKRFEEMMLEHYGVSHPIQSEIITERKKKTNLEKYGVDHYSKTNEYKEKIKKTSLKRYGVDHHLKSKDVKEKCKITVIEKYGVDHVMKNQCVKNKVLETKENKYGDPNYNNSTKAKNTKEMRYGNSSYTNKEKAEQTNIEKYGVNNPFKSPEIIENLSNLRKERLERDNVRYLKILAKEKGVSLGRNWNRRKDEWINQKILELEKLN